MQRYPEVWRYFYGLVDLSLPATEEPGVRDPPLSALGGGKGRVRVRSQGREGDAREGGVEGGGGERGLLRPSKWGQGGEETWGTVCAYPRV